MKKKLFVSVIGILFLAMITAGCGKSSASSSASDEVTKSIKSTKTLTVGTDATFPPFESKENGKYVGFDIDLTKAIAKKVGATKVKFVDTEFSGLITGLQAKKFDMVASGVYITASRKKAVSYSDTYYPGGLCILTKKGTKTITKLSDLKGKKVAVQVGTKSVDFLTKNMKTAQLVKTDTNNEMFLSLETGKADAVVTGLPAAQAYMKSHSDVKVAAKNLSDEKYGFVFRKDDTAIRGKVNKALKELKKDGTYDKIVKKWFAE